MYNVVFVEILDPSHYLPHEETAVGLGQIEIISSHSLEELPAVQVLHHQDHFTWGLESVDKPERI